MCEQAGIELIQVPLTQQYWDSVVTSALSDIRAGLTPNPDILCNSRQALLSAWHADSLLPPCLQWLLCMGGCAAGACMDG